MTEHYAIILLGFEIFLISPNLLKFQVLNRSASPEATCIYYFITNNHASFHLCEKENLVKHQKVSKYYDRNYRS